MHSHFGQNGGGFKSSSVLILVVMEDALALLGIALSFAFMIVLILVVMEDALAQKPIRIYFENPKMS